jgi:hypothetical protein
MFFFLQIFRLNIFIYFFLIFLIHTKCLYRLILSHLIIIISSSKKVSFEPKPSLENYVRFAY